MERLLVLMEKLQMVEELVRVKVSLLEKKGQKFLHLEVLVWLQQMTKLV